MRIKLIGTSALLVLALSLPAAAGPLDANIIPHDASVVAHIDIDAIRGSHSMGVTQNKLGQQIQAAKREMIAELAPLDVDLLFDASSVTFWGKGNDAENGAVIIEGLDTRRAVAMLQQIPGHSSKRFKGVTVHRIDGEGAIAVVDSRVILAKEREDLMLTIDTIDGRETSIKRSRSMPDLRATRGSFLVVAVDDKAARALQKQASSALLSKGSIQGAVLEIGERRRDVMARLTVETSGRAVATKLREVVSGGAALLSLAADEPELTRLLSSLSVTQSGSSVTAEISADPAMLIDVAKQAI